MAGNDKKGKAKDPLRAADVTPVVRGRGVAALAGAQVRLSALRRPPRRVAERSELLEHEPELGRLRPTGDWDLLNLEHLRFMAREFERLPDLLPDLGQQLDRWTAELGAGDNLSKIFDEQAQDSGQAGRYPGIEGAPSSWDQEDSEPGSLDVTNALRPSLDIRDHTGGTAAEATPVPGQTTVRTGENGNFKIEALYTDGSVFRQTSRNEGDAVVFSTTRTYVNGDEVNIRTVTAPDGRMYAVHRVYDAATGQVRMRQDGSASLIRQRQGLPPLNDNPDPTGGADLPPIAAPGRRPDFTLTKKPNKVNPGRGSALDTPSAPRLRVKPHDLAVDPDGRVRDAGSSPRNAPKFVVPNRVLPQRPGSGPEDPPS